MTLATADFEFIRQLIRKECCIVLEDGKEYLVDLRLGILSENEGFGSIGGLVKYLVQTGDTELTRKVVDAMTTNETLFFRDLKPFETLRKELIPELINARKTEQELNIWSAASSTGQEAYSVAMVLDKHFPELKTWKVKIWASDISYTCVNYARAALYNQFEVNRGLPATYLIRYFDKAESRWQLKSEIKNKVQFMEYNMAKEWPYLPKMDIIFMSNVMIYFDLETKKEILRKVRRQINPDGYLFLGSAETTMNIDPFFERRTTQDNSNCYHLSR